MARLVNLLLSLCLAAILLVNGEQLGDEDFSEMIVGGERATEVHPYRVSLRNVGFPEFDPDFHGCGGSILNTRWILTAAHCIGYFPNEEALTTTRIVVGSLNPRQSGERYVTQRIVIHPLWTRSFVNRNDVGLIQTDRPIVFNEFVQPISVSRRIVRAGDVVTVGGWGGESAGLFPEYIMAEEMNEINLTVISNLECRRRLLPIPAFSLLINDNIFCTFMGRGVGVCSGDSGSGVVMNGQLVGVASNAIPCANGFPDWFPRLNVYANWIESIISI